MRKRRRKHARLHLLGRRGVWHPLTRREEATAPEVAQQSRHASDALPVTLGDAVPCALHNITQHNATQRHPPFSYRQPPALQVYIQV